MILKRIGEGFLRGLGVGAGLLVLIVPTLLLLVWSAAYLFGVYNTALSPGLPVVMDYEASGGRYQLYAERYQVDPRRGVAIVDGAKLRDPSGVVVGSASRLDIRWGHGPVAIQGNQIALTIEREKDRYSYERALPPSDGKPSDQAFDVALRNIDLRFIDRTKPTPAVARARITDLTTAGTAESQFARANGEIVGMGPFQLRLSAGSKVLTVAEMRTPGFDIARARPIAERFWGDALTKTLSPLGVNRAMIQGRVALRLGKEPMILQAGGQLDADGLSYTGFARNLSVKGPFWLDLDHAVLKASAIDGATQASFDGRIDYANGVDIVGNLSARAPSIKSLPERLRAGVPREISAQNITYDGLISWVDEKLELAGDVGMRNLSAYNERLENTNSRVVLANNQIQLVGFNGTWMGRRLAGSLSARPDGSGLRGFADVSSGPLDPLVGRFGLKGVTGTVAGKLIVEGSLKRPVLSAALRGRADYLDRKQRFALGNYYAALNLNGDTLNIPRFTVEGSGASLIQGSVNLRQKTLDLQVKAGGIDAQKFLPQVAGRLFVDGKVTGTFSKPLAQGRAEVYGASYDGANIPIALGNFRASGRQIDLTDMSLISGASEITANLSVGLNDRSLKGNFESKNLQMSDWAYLPLGGVLTVSSGAIRGSISSPIVTSRITSEDLNIGETSLSSAEAELSLKGGNLRLGSLVASFAGGTLRGNANYELKSKTLRASLEGENIDIKSATNALPGYSPEGKASGRLWAVVRDGKVLRGDTALSLENFTMNGFLVGSGNVRAKAEGTRYSANAQLGTIERFTELSGAVYDSKTGEASGDLLTNNMPLSPILKAIKKETKVELAPDLQRLIESTEGSIASAIRVSSQGKDLVFNVRDFTLSNLTIEGRDAGTISLSGMARNDEIQAKNFKWQLPEGQMEGSATIRGDKIDEARLNAVNLPLDWVRIVVPEAPRMPFNLSASLDLSGTLKNPLGQVSGTIEGTRSAEISADDRLKEVPSLLFNFTVREGLIDGESLFQAYGFKGKATTSMPLTFLAPKGESEGEFRTDISVDPRPISEFVALMPGLDTAISKGTVTGSATLRGPLGNIELNAGLDIVSEKLKLKDYKTALEDARLQLRADPKTVKISGSGRSSDGGSFVVNAQGDANQDMWQAPGVEDFLDRTKLTGKIQFDRLAVKNLEFGVGGIATIAGTGTIDLSGSMLNPIVGGDVSISQGDLVVPGETPNRATANLLVNPTFRSVGVRLSEPMRVRTGTADLKLVGSGAVNGSLAAPAVLAQMRLDEGRFDLPNARIRLEEGGSLEFRLLPSPISESAAQLIVDLEGRSNISARRTGDTFERYDITLYIRGDLLSEKDVRLTAESDPSDLSEQEILAILGQRELFEALTDRRVGSQGRLQQTLIGLAVPNLTQGLTRSLAYGFGLDYVGLDYNAFDGATVTAVKTLSKGLTLTGRQQLQETTYGPRQYELKLTYRIPSKDRLLSRSRIGFGFTNQVPWRVTFEYVLRVK